MASLPPNPDTRELPYGWIQQYNPQYRQWFYVNTREQPPRSSWEHPLGPVPPSFAPPPGPPPPDHSYSRSPYGGPPPPSQGYGGYQSSYGGPPPQGYYNNAPPPSNNAPSPSNNAPPPSNNAPPGGYVSGPTQGYPQNPQNKGNYPQQEVVYVDQQQQQRKQKKGFGLGTAALAGAAGLAGGALLMNALGDHDEREREEGFEEGYQDGYDDNQEDNWGGW